MKYIIQRQYVRHSVAYLLHRCMFHWQVNTVHHSYSCSYCGSPFRMCKMGRGVSISSRPSQACIHTPLSRGDTCKMQRQYKAGCTHNTVTTMSSFPKGKAATAQNWPFATIQWWCYKSMQLYLHTPFAPTARTQMRVLNVLISNNKLLVCLFVFVLFLIFWCFM